MRLLKLFRTVIALFVATFSTGAFAGASISPFDYQGTYYFSGSCLDCIAQTTQPSPVTAKLVIGDSYANSSFEYYSVKLGQLVSTEMFFISLGDPPITEGFESVSLFFTANAPSTLVSGASGAAPLTSVQLFFDSFTTGQWALGQDDFGVSGVWSLTPIPEPQTLALWLLGLTAVGSVGRRKWVRQQA